MIIIETHIDHMKRLIDHTKRFDVLLQEAYEKPYQKGFLNKITYQYLKIDYSIHNKPFSEIIYVAKSDAHDKEHTVTVLLLVHLNMIKPLEQRQPLF